MECLQCGGSLVEAFPTRSLAYVRSRRYCSRECYYVAQRGVSNHPRTGVVSDPTPRFWAKVAVGAPGECWEWIGARDKHGYGVLLRATRPSRFWKTHRFSYELHYGPIPDGLFVCHHCDNPPCVNPAHLFLGTAGDNNRDRSRKQRGREARQDGADNPRAKVTAEQVEEIRRRCANGETQISVGADYGIKQQQVSRIVRRVQWL